MGGGWRRRPGRERWERTRHKNKSLGVRERLEKKSGDGSGGRGRSFRGGFVLPPAPEERGAARRGESSFSLLRRRELCNGTRAQKRGGGRACSFFLLLPFFFFGFFFPIFFASLFPFFYTSSRPAFVPFLQLFRFFFGRCCLSPTPLLDFSFFLSNAFFDFFHLYTPLPFRKSACAPNTILQPTNHSNPQLQQKLRESRFSGASPNRTMRREKASERERERKKAGKKRGAQKKRCEKGQLEPFFKKMLHSQFMLSSRFAG